MRELPPSKEQVEKPYWVPDNALRRMIRECEQSPDALHSLQAHVLKGICADLLDHRTAPEPAPGLPGCVRRDAERAIEEALHPKGMSAHDGKARVQIATLQRLLAIADRSTAQPPGDLRAELKSYLRAIGASPDGITKQSITAFLMWREDRAASTKEPGL